jgi:hypothetical protein
MRKVRVLALIGMLLTANTLAIETEMQPIAKFLEGESTLSDAGVQFVGLRCFALFSILSAYSNDNGMPDKGARFEKAGDVALARAIEASKRLNQDFLQGQIKLMVDGYTQRWLKAKALTGNFSDDSVISADLPVCTGLFGKSQTER